jgi:hypothetical protein
VLLEVTPHRLSTRICKRRPRIIGEDLAGEGATAEPTRETLAALLTASLSAKLADAVSEMVGAAYDAQIVRIEPHAHGGAEVLVAFVPRPPEHTLKLVLGADTVEMPLPPGVVDAPPA